MVSDTGLPSGWKPRYSRSHQKPYVWNESEHVSEWNAPPGTDVEQLELYLNQKIQASHLLIKHNQSRNPKSWRQDPITRSKDEARVILEGHREAILAAARDGRYILPDLCKTESDCSSASKEGSLGTFGFGQMQEPFWDASVALKQYGLSDIVDTESGLHLIQRWNADPEKPKRSTPADVAPIEAIPAEAA